MTTPEKSRCLRTAAARESFSSTVPVTVAPTSDERQAALKQIRKSHIIMIVQPQTGSEISGSNLGRLQAGQQVRSKPVENVPGILHISANAAESEIGIPVVFLATVNVKRKPLRGAKRDLSPTADGMNSAQITAGSEVDALLQTAHGRDIFTLEEHACNIEARPGPDQPVERKDVGRNGCAADMAAAGVKPGGELDAPAAAEIVPQFEAALEARTHGSDRPVILRRS